VDLLSVHGSDGRVFATGRHRTDAGDPGSPAHAVLERVNGTWVDDLSIPMINGGGGAASVWVASADLAYFTGDHAFARFDGSSWSFLVEPPWRVNAQGTRSVWAAPDGRAFRVGAAWQDDVNDYRANVMQYRDGEVTDITPPGLADGPIVWPVQGIWGTNGGSTLFIVGIANPVPPAQTGVGYVLRRTGH